MPTDTKIRLLIADDHKYLIDGVMLSLEDTDIQVVSHTMNVHEIVALNHELQPDVLLIDIMFGQDKTGLDIVEEVLSKDPNTRIIIFSQYDQDELIQKSYSMGVQAFLTKSTKLDVLIEAITAASRGEVFFTDDIAHRLASLVARPQSSPPLPQDVLTQKELNVFCLLAKGLTEQEIAKELGFHHRTITSNKASIKEKLRISRPAEFTIAALKGQLITLD